MNLSNSWHLVIAFLGTMSTFTAAVQTNSDLTGSGTPGWTYLVGFGMSALTTLLVAKKSDPRVQQFEAMVAALEQAIEKANGATPAPSPTPAPAPILNPIPVINDVVNTGTDILDEINKIIGTFRSQNKSLKVKGK